MMKSEAVIRGSASGLVLHCFPLHPVQGVKKRYIFMASCLMHHLDVYLLMLPVICLKCRGNWFPQLGVRCIYQAAVFLNHISGLASCVNTATLQSVTLRLYSETPRHFHTQMVEHPDFCIILYYSCWACMLVWGRPAVRTLSTCKQCKSKNMCAGMWSLFQWDRLNNPSYIFLEVKGNV